MRYIANDKKRESCERERERAKDINRHEITLRGLHSKKNKKNIFQILHLLAIVGTTKHDKEGS